MKLRLLFSALLIPFLAQAQENVQVKGRIVDSRGEAVEYVQVGIPKYHIGTISTVDGHFEIEVPCDTLQFFHVSYQTAFFPVTGSSEDLVIVLEEQELPPAVSIGGNTKEKFLLRPGTKVMGNLAQAAFYRPDGVVKGWELGSVAVAKKPFLVRDIMFSIVSNHIPGCVVSINVYRIEGDPESFENVLHKPIYADIALSDSPKNYTVHPEESVLLDPGKYFIAFQIVATDEDAVKEYQATPEAERDPDAMHMYATLYFKSSYERDAVMGEMHRIPVNIGVSVKGLEFQ